LATPLYLLRWVPGTRFLEWQQDLLPACTTGSLRTAARVGANLPTFPSSGKPKQKKLFI